MAEHHVYTVAVRGSNPLPPTIFNRNVAQLGRALALGASCCRFKSYHSDHFRAYGEIEDTKVLEAFGAIRVGASPTMPTIFGRMAELV